MSEFGSNVDPVDGFDLTQYRNAVLKYVKLMIRARTKEEPDFLDGAQYDRWKLSDIADDTYSIEALLPMAEAAREHLWREFIGPHGSGGVAADDPRGELKQAVVRFAMGTSPEALLRQWRDRSSINWDEAAEWGLLDEIRDGLDGIPSAGSGQSGCPVVILDHKQRLVEVLGQKKELSQARFAIIKALIEQYPGTHTKDELVSVSGREGALSSLKGLRDNDPIWVP